jgi:small subunit ribosomal protein S18
MMLSDDNLETSKTPDKSGSDRSGSTKMFFRKRKGCPLCVTDSPAIDYKDSELLVKFISEGGRMLPSRITNVCAKHQRKLKKAIRLSRIIALLPFVFQSR